MKTLVPGVAVLIGLLLANLGAAGVVLGLGLLLRGIAPELQSHWPWVAIGAAGVTAAVLFLKAVLSLRLR